LAPLLGSPGPKQSVDLVALARSAPRAPARAQPREDRSQDSRTSRPQPVVSEALVKDDGAAAPDDAAAPPAKTVPKASGRVGQPVDALGAPRMKLKILPPAVLAAAFFLAGCGPAILTERGL